MEYECKKVNLHIRSIFSLSEDFEKKHLYWHDDKNKKYVNIESEYDLMAYGAENNIYTRTEKPWWVGCEGMPVMTCLGMAILDKYVDGKTPFHTNLGGFNHARLLTSAERDAIKVRD